MLTALALAMTLCSIGGHSPWHFSAKSCSGFASFCREEEERGNAMKALENRTLDSKREMDIMNALDEMQSLNARHERVDTEAALAALRRSAVEDEDVSQFWGEEPGGGDCRLGAAVSVSQGGALMSCTSAVLWETQL